MQASDHPHIQALIQVSERAGRNPLLVQANAGNTSIKIDGVLWIKASGKWLAHAGREEIFVPVDLNGIRSAIGRQQVLSPRVSGSHGQGPAPSTETPMHAVVPFAATIHVHSVNVIAWAVQQNGPHFLAQRLKELPWAWIPYVPSGLPLAREVEKVFAKAPETRILILGNHGLVVCAEDPWAAEELLMMVEQRLAIEPRQGPKFDRRFLLSISDGTEWCVPDEGPLHALSDPFSQALVRGILYPCQAIFVGLAAPVLTGSLPPDEAANRYKRQFGVVPRFFIVENRGAIVSRSITPAEREMLVGLAEVARRVDSGAHIRYLTETEVEAALRSDG